MDSILADEFFASAVAAGVRNETDDDVPVRPARSAGLAQIAGASMGIVVAFGGLGALVAAVIVGGWWILTHAGDPSPASVHAAPEPPVVANVVGQPPAVPTEAPVDPDADSDTTATAAAPGATDAAAAPAPRAARSTAEGSAEAAPPAEATAAEASGEEPKKKGLRLFKKKDEQPQ